MSDVFRATSKADVARLASANGCLIAIRAEIARDAPAGLALGRTCGGELSGAARQCVDGAEGDMRFCGKTLTNRGISAGFKKKAPTLRAPPAAALRATRAHSE